MRDGAANTVRTLQANLAQLAGVYASPGTARPPTAPPSGAGNYTVVIAATGPAGTRQRSLDVQVVAPVLGSVSAAPAAFYAGSGSTTFSYTLAAAATTSVVVADGTAPRCAP